MKVLFLADCTSTHTANWIRYLSDAGTEIFLFSLTACKDIDYKNVKTKHAGFDFKTTNTDKNDRSKLRYLKAIRIINRIIDDFKPDILHAHYATSYGLLGVLTHFRPLIISVWGSDIFYFPKKTFIHRALLKFNLNHADAILSTSKAMATETRLYTKKMITVTPFGIDTECFTFRKVDSLFDKDSIVIGTVKTLDRIYGIEYLIKAFILLKPKYAKIKLLLVGGCTRDNEGYMNYLKSLIEENDIEDDVIFTGRVPHNKVPDYHNMLDIPVYVSLRESFGVSALESQSCEKAVIVSNVGGLPETVENGITGFIVPSEDERSTAKAIEVLILNEQKRIEMGKKAREWVLSNYSKKTVTRTMLKVYNKILID